MNFKFVVVWKEVSYNNKDHRKVYNNMDTIGILVTYVLSREDTDICVYLSHRIILDCQLAFPLLLGATFSFPLSPASSKL